jgi:Fe-S oxidoreductase/nitrate reductase gamma subunit
MNADEATRQILWNISYGWLMYVLLIPTMAVFIYGFYQHIARWRQGTVLDRFDSPCQRVMLLVGQVFNQSRIARKTIAGVFHRFIVWGFVVFALATLVVLIQYDFNIVIMKGYFYLYFQSFIVDIFGALSLIGIIIAATRRWVSRPDHLIYNTESNVILLVLFAIIVSGFFLEGWRIAATNDPWAAWSPVGFMTAKAFLMFFKPEHLQAAHQTTWWIHLFIVYGFIAWIPYGKMRHLFTSAANTYTSNLQPIGANLKFMDLEDEESETLGVNRLDGFTWKDLLDLDACTACGRCTENCPANISGKLLSPRDIILDLQKLLHQQPVGKKDKDQRDSTESIDIFATINPEILWDCTTCAACVEACPVHIEQLPKIIDMRRYQIMEEAEAPETIMDAVMSIEERGHPIRGTRATRLDWTKGLDIPLISEKPDADILFWVGSAGALVERSQQVTRAFARILIDAGIDFAILGREEKATGDLARRTGNEFLFQTIASENIDILDQYHVKNIVTTCPHAFNTLSNEYPQLGGNYTVTHSTEYLMQLLASGRIKIPNSLEQTITFHDPCYLSRHNYIVDAPRNLLNSACIEPIIEMENSKKSSFCCGGGGGMSFAEEEPEKRVSRFRARQALDTGADIVAVACPYCMTMMEDGVKAEQKDRDIKVLDIVEVVSNAMKL